jgi:tetratricopeptide (TPR) repeat protein
VIAMPAPDPLRGGFGSFNWAVVLRHEYTHTVTLSATENRIPHWFTEACAVWEQPDRRNFEAVALLVEAVRRGQLYAVTTLDWGFIRPDPRRGPQARGLAYAQSEWIFEYVVEKKGYDAIPQMLRGFRDGLTQAKVFDKVLGTTQEQFDKDFAAWAKVQVASWGFDPEPPPDLAKATEAAKSAPESADAQANLARALYQARQFRQAEAPARQALKIDPNHKRALLVLGYVLLAQKKHEEVLQIGKRLEEVDARSADAARLQAEACLAQQKWLEAIAALENFKSRRQLDPFAYEKLARLYDQLGEPEKALPNLAELHRRTMRDPKYARQVADIYRTSDTPEKALDFWEQVIQINPYDAGVYKAMASLYLRAKNYERAILAMRSACLLEPDGADSWANLAAVYFRVGKAEKSVERLSQAVSAAEKALGIDPTSPAGQVKAAAEELMTTLHSAP